MTDFETKYRDLVAGVTALADDFDTTVGFRGAATALRALLASSPAEREGEGRPTEVFEVIERLSGRRVMEHVHLTGQAALDWIENGIPAKDHGKYRAQSVKVYAAPAPVSSGEAGEQVDPDFCPLSTHVRGQVHSWKFDGDDPYIICHFCQEMRDAHTGRVVRPAPVVTPSTEGSE